MKTGNQFVRKTDFKIVTANTRMIKQADRLANLETAEVIRERSRNRNHKPAPAIQRYLELARRARMARAGMAEALEIREEIIPLDSLFA